MATVRENYKTLVRNGQRDSVVALLRDRADAARAAYAEIENAPGYTDDHRRWLLAQEASRRLAQVDREVESSAAASARDDRDDHAAVFGIDGLTGDAASLMISRRDAADRADQCESESELRDLMRRATRNGDEVLARACAERALERQDAQTMNLFLDTRPDLDEAANRLWNAERAEGPDAFELTMLQAALRPESMQGTPQETIDALAAGGPPEAPAEPAHYQAPPARISAIPPGWRGDAA